MILHCDTCFLELACPFFGSSPTIFSKDKSGKADVSCILTKQEGFSRFVVRIPIEFDLNQLGNVLVVTVRAVEIKIPFGKRKAIKKAFEKHPSD